MGMDFFSDWKLNLFNLQLQLFLNLKKLCRKQMYLFIYFLSIHFLDYEINK